MMPNQIFDTMAGASESNFENSISFLLADALFTAGYLVYWYVSDGLQTPDGWYPGYRANQSTYLADTTVAARVAAAKGLFTFVDRPSALPRSPTRPTTGGTVAPQGLVQVPAASIEAGDIVTGDPYELGTLRRWRSRILTLTGLMRSTGEQSEIADLLTVTFDEDSMIDILDHDGATLAVLGNADVLKVSVDRATNLGGADAEQYEVTLMAQLQFVA